MLKNTLMLAALLFCSLAAAGEEDGPIQTDRPGFGDGTYVMPKGTFQYEFGYAHQRYDNKALLGGSQDVDEHTVGEVLMRYGISSRVELRLSLGSFVWQSRPDDSGFSDGAVGMKYRWIDRDDLKVSLLATANVETGVTFGDSDLGISYAAAANYKGMDGYLSWDTNNEEILASVYSGGELTEKMSYSLGVAAIFGLGDTDVIRIEDIIFNGQVLGTSIVEGPETIDVEDQLLFDMNLLYSVSDRAQLDFYLGAGLNDDSPDYFLGMGYGYRF